MRYLVRWEVEVESDTPRDAAKMAARIQQVANDDVFQVASMISEMQLSTPYRKTLDDKFRQFIKVEL